MNWKLIGALSAGVGVVFGIISLFGVATPAIGWVITLTVSAGCAIVLVIKVPAQHFAHGFWTGFLAAVLKTLIAAVFADTYMRANPEFSQQLSQMPVSINPRILLLLAAPFAGLFSGLMLGVITWVVAKILGPDRPAPAQPA
jgi:hypothetical protein